MSAFRGSRWVSLLSFAGALAALAGCGQQAGSTTAAESTGTSEHGVSTETAEAEGAAPAPGEVDEESGREGRRPGFGQAPGRRHGPPGPDSLLVAALHELELTAEQKTTIQAELDKLKPGSKGHALTAGGPIAALAQGVRAGKIDPADLLAKLGPVETGAEARGAALAGAIQTLHATLTKEQRGALVDAVQKRAEGRGPGDGFAGKGGPREGAVRPPVPGAGHLPGPLGFMLDGVELTQAQRDAIGKALEARKPSLPDPETMQKRHEAMRAQMHERLATFATFAADAFDAKAFVAPPEGAKAGGPGHPFEAMVNDLAVVVPLLEPAQREALAARLEKGPPAFHGRMGGAPGGRGRRGPQ